MHTIESVYYGELSTQAKHLKSGSIIITDAPVDNNGKGQAFSPTDLLAASLGSCMLTLMGIAAEARNIDLKGTHITINKIMETNPRRVSEIVIDIFMNKYPYSEEAKTVLEYAAINCPVAKSLHPELIQNITFHY